ncbi:MAG: hypothetical protein WD181_00110 [Solirubrobacterales bacterium]
MTLTHSNRLRQIAAALLVAGISFGFAACSSGNGGDEAARSAPSASDFPSAEGKTIEEVRSEQPESELAISPAASVFEPGSNRYPFGVFELDKTQIDDAEVALYFAKTPQSEVEGPLPARIESLSTKPAFRSLGVEAPGEARSYYVVENVEFDRSGPWTAIAIIKDGDGFQSSRLPSPVVGQFPGVAAVGEKAPKTSTPTVASVGGDLSKIDTRQPPSSMHDADLKNVLGRKPVILIFATPAFCSSRVCGPVVDVAEQVKAESGSGIQFIHMEIFNDNDPSKGVRPQLAAFGLPTEPWMFAIGSDGRIVERTEGALGVREMTATVNRLKAYEAP